MIKSYLLLVTLLAYSTVCAANNDEPVNNAQACSLPIIEKKINHEILLAEFNQSKFIATLAKPLASNGVMFFEQNRGMVWQTDKPIKSTSVITEQGIAQFNSRNQKSNLTQNMANGSEQISTVFLGLFSGDMQNLNQNFAIQHQCDGESWLLTLTAKNDRLTQFLQDIHIKGHQNIQTITLFESNNDKTIIDLQPLTDKALQSTLENYFELQ